MNQPLLRLEFKKIVFLFLLFLVDRFIKLFVYYSGLTFFLPKQFIKIQLWLNPVAAWGIPSPLWLLIILNIAVIFILFLWANKLLKSGKFYHPFAWWLIFIGGISNLLDRIWFQGVIDFLHIGWLPVFNLADVYIIVGGAYLLYIFYIKERYGRKSFF